MVGSFGAEVGEVLALDLVLVSCFFFVFFAGGSSSRLSSVGESRLAVDPAAGDPALSSSDESERGSHRV